MEKILEKARMILRNVYVALGAAAMPVSVYAGYGQPQPDLSSYTVPLRGRVVSEETGEPVAGIRVWYEPYANANTDGDGRFLIYVPEENLYSLWFFDYDGFENGGFFSNKNMSIARDGIEAPLAVSLYRERQAVVIRGTVLAKETGKPLSRIKVSIQSRDGESGIYSLSAGFEVLSDHEGQFYIQVPERDTYVIDFFDTNSLFQWKALRLTSDEIKDPLQVDLEQIPREETGKNGE